MSMLSRDTTLVDLSNRATRLSVAAPKTEFEQAGKTFRLAGHEATPCKGAIFGRAMLLENYARYVSPELEKLRYTDTAEEITATLRKLDGVD